MAKGINVSGDTAVVSHTYVMPTGNFDCAVMWGSYKTTGKHIRYNLKKTIIENFEKYIVAETPLVGRKIKSNHVLPLVRLGINGHLRSKADFPTKIDVAKAEKFLEKYTPSLKKQRGNQILVVMQTENDSSLEGEDIFAWTLDTVIKLRKYTDRKICVRSHPFTQSQNRLTDLKNSLEKIENVIFQTPTDSLSIDIDDQLEKTFATVIFSSGTGVDSILKGIPVVALSELSMCYPVATHDIAKIESAQNNNTQEWLSQLAMMHYTLDELQSGKWWGIYKDLL